MTSEAVAGDRSDSFEAITTDRYELTYAVPSALYRELAGYFDGQLARAAEYLVTTAYFDTPEYVAALAKSIDDGVKALPFKPDVVLTSYHGMPELYLQRGDPYYCQCLKTTRLVRETLGWSEDQIRVTFQSRFGPTEWLKPYTVDVLEELARDKKKVALVAPAFSVDCIETLEEIAITGHEQFVHAGGGHDDYAYIPCLNDSDVGMGMLEAVVRNELKGWM